MHVAFYKGTRPGLQGIYSRAVRFIDRGPYSHCELIFSDGLAASASFIDKGVRFKNIEFDDNHWDFIEIPWANESIARQWFLDHEGQPYDLSGNLHFILGPVPESKDEWFCNESISAAIGIQESWRVGPNGFYQILIMLNHVYSLKE